VDFSLFDATEAVVAVCVEKAIALVCATTGLSPE